jgi:cytochrome c-type biogenesis protein CcmH
MFTKFFCVALIAAAQAFAMQETPAQQQTRIDRLEKSVLAPCCYTQPVSQHQSEIAVKMRLEMARWVREGRSDQEILDTYVQQYGSRVLVDPDTIPKGWTVVVPWAVAVFGAIGAGLLLLRWRARRAAVAAPNGSGTDLPDISDLDN